MEIFNQLMNFESIVIFSVFILYATVAISYLLKGEYAWAFVWGGYSLSNIGLIIAQSK